MARNKTFDKLHAALVTSKAPEQALQAAIHAVKAIYSGNDPEMALALLNDTPQYMREKFASWLASYGAVVGRPIGGSSEYRIGDAAGLVKDARKQSKVFAELADLSKVRPVLVEELKAAKVKKPVELKGEAEDRAVKAVTATIARIKKDDPDTAALINDAWAKRNAVSPEFGLVVDNTLTTITADEAAQLAAALAAIRAQASNTKRREVIKQAA